MDPRQILRDYVASCGTYQDAADKFGCARITIQKVLGGQRGVGKELAYALEANSGGALQFADMIRIEQVATQAKRANRKPRKARARGRK